MPGQPIRRAIVAELTRRAWEELGSEDPLDWCEEYVESGGTWLKLAAEWSESLGIGPMSRAAVSNAVHSLGPDPAEGEERESVRRMALARVRSAPALIEEGMQLLDTANALSPGGVAKAKAQADWRARVAGWHDPKTYGEKSNSVTINVTNVASDALRRIVNPLLEQRVAAQVAATARLVSGEPNEVVVEDAVVYDADPVALAP